MFLHLCVDDYNAITPVSRHAWVVVPDYDLNLNKCNNVISIIYKKAIKTPLQQFKINA